MRKQGDKQGWWPRK